MHKRKFLCFEILTIPLSVTSYLFIFLIKILNFSFIIDQWSPCSASCGEGIKFRKVECKIFLEFSKTVATLPDKECPGIKHPETQICVEQPSCGADQIQSDNVNILSETLPSINGPEILALTSEESKEPSYMWKIAGFTTCTASCLGGNI